MYPNQHASLAITRVSYAAGLGAPYVCERTTVNIKWKPLLVFFTHFPCNCVY